MSGDEKQRWSEGADAASTMLTTARRTHDWDSIDRLAELLGVGDAPEQRGAWEALVDELSQARFRRP